MLVFTKIWKAEHHYVHKKTMPEEDTIFKSIVVDVTNKAKFM